MCKFNTVFLNPPSPMACRVKVTSVIDLNVVLQDKKKENGTEGTLVIKLDMPVQYLTLLLYNETSLN